MFGVVGANNILKKKFLEYVARAAKNKIYFSNTTYSLIYNLVNNNKVVLFFTPKIKIKKFLVSGDPVQVVGAYNPDTRRIEIFVEWKINFDAIIQIFNQTMPLVLNKVFAIILSEALLIYDYKNNGELSKYDKIKKWFSLYFEGVIGDSLPNQHQLALKIADLVSQDYGATMYERVEKPYIERKAISFKFDKKGDNPDLDIEGIPSIKKGKKQLEDLFGDAVKDYIDQNLDKLGVGHNESYGILKKFCDDYGEFGAFLWQNKELELNPKDLEEVPEDYSGGNDNNPYAKLRKEAESATLRALQKQAEKEEQQELKDYLEKNPEIKAIYDKSKDNDWDRMTTKYFGKLANWKTNIALEKDKDGKMRMIPSKTSIKTADGRTVTDVTQYVNSDKNEDFISLFLLGKDCSSQDILDAVNGVEQCYKLARKANTDLATRQGVYNDAEDVRFLAGAFKSTKKMSEMRDVTQKQFDTAFHHLRLLMAQISKGTPSEKIFSLTHNLNVNSSFDKNPELFFKQIRKSLKKQQNITSDNQELMSSPGRSAIALFGDQRRNLSALTHNLNGLYTLMTSTNASESQRIRARDDFKKKAQLAINEIKKMPYVSTIIDVDIEKAKKYATLVKQYQQLNGYLNDSHKTIESINNDIYGGSDVHTNFNRIFGPNAHFGKDIKISNIESAVKGIVSFAKNVKDDIDNNRIPNNLKDARAKGISFNEKTTSLINSLAGNNNIFGTFKINNRDVDIIQNINGQIQLNSEIQNYLNANGINEIEKRKRLKELFTRLNSPSQTGETIGSQVSQIKNYVQLVSRENAHFISPETINKRSANLKQIRSFYKSRTTQSLQDKIKETRDQLKQLGIDKNSMQKLSKILKDKPELFNVIDAEFIDKDGNIILDKFNPDKMLALVNNIDDLDAIIRHKGDILKLADKNLLDRQRPDLYKDYMKEMFVNGVGFLYNCLPSWNDVVKVAKTGYFFTKNAIKFLKSVYRTAKIILPLKQNIEPFVHQQFGFEKMAKLNYFDVAYNLTFKVKKMYELRKGTVRKDFTYCELFLPVTILMKVLYQNLITQNDFDDTMLYLLNCANKGLEEFL